ncbi:hypothetical protein [Streptomyces cavernae]|uniref:hypothetical protein n=1 Tax=Streptomyces cavernae TaxID=2259034 RepID=UPI000FEB8A95|nr:hypothetical protein [Streptomyces cavernae]
MNSTVAPSGYRRLASGHAPAHCAAIAAPISRHGTGPSATEWWPSTARTLPRPANNATRTPTPARLALAVVLALGAR